MLLLAFAAALGPARLPPVDQCINDRSFVEYRTRLWQAIDRRDAKALLPLVADDVHASLGGHVGKKDFIELWSLGRPRSSKLWEELRKALALGCIIRAGVPTSPSFEDRLGEDRDPFEVRIALPGAVLRRDPSERSPAIARLDWHVLTPSGTWDGGPWVPVRLDDGRRGYVREALARSPIDYRAWFDKRGGRWVMAGFLAGD